MKEAAFVRSEQELDAFWRAFKAAAWPRADWSHAAHVAMAAYDLLTEGKAGAVERIREAILHYAAGQGIVHTPTSGYHETLTRFWIERVAEVLAALPAGLSRFEAVRETVKVLGSQRDLHRSYYSFDVVNSAEARATWVAPDSSFSAVPGNN